MGAIVRLALAAVLALMWRPSAAVAQGCVGSPIAIQILGSGGPFVNADRASSSYLVWSGEQARVLVDAGGGAFFRFGQTRAKLSDLSLLAISHLHPDHVSDLPALLWLSDVARQETLPISGPSGNDVAPGFATFLAIAVGANNPLHAAPDVVGRVAQEARVGRLVVSHIGQFNLDEAIADLKRYYTGPLTVGADMQCTPVP